MNILRDQLKKFENIQEKLKIKISQNKKNTDYIRIAKFGILCLQNLQKLDIEEALDLVNETFKHNRLFQETLILKIYTQTKIQLIGQMKIQLKQKIQDYQQRIILITKRRGIIQKDQLIEALQNYQDLVHLNRQYSLAFIRIVQNNIKLLGRAMRLQAIIMIN